MSAGKNRIKRTVWKTLKIQIPSCLTRLQPARTTQLKSRTVWYHRVLASDKQKKKPDSKNWKCESEQPACHQKMSVLLATQRKQKWIANGSKTTTWPRQDSWLLPRGVSVTNCCDDIKSHKFQRVDTDFCKQSWAKKVDPRGVARRRHVPAGGLPVRAARSPAERRILTLLTW